MVKKIKETKDVRSVFIARLQKDMTAAKLELNSPFQVHRFPTSIEIIGIFIKILVKIFKI
jgi:hypothetical protein